MRGMFMSYLVIKDAEKTFNDLQVLKQINVSIEEGKLISLLGPSGSGKSTLLRCIAGLETLNSGSIIVDGEDITEKDPKNRNIGMMFQSYVLFPNMTVLDNIAFGLKMKKVAKSERKQRAMEMVEKMDLLGKEYSYPDQLSGGQKQRVALARALVMEPKILLFDEPLGALDRKIRKQLQLYIKKVQRDLNITSVFVTHDQEEAMIMSDEIFVMNEGVVEQQGTPKEIYTNPKTPFVAVFIGNYNVFTANEFENMFHIHAVSGTEVAIRPEVIQIEKAPIQKEGHFIAERCVVSDISIIGNVVRYEVLCGEKKISIESIHFNLQEIRIGDTVHLIIPKSECIYLENSNREQQYNDSIRAKIS
jgi:putative spermidine/putrescine transport system ATP-binding protein